MLSIKLNPVPETHRSEYDELMKGEWLAWKVERETRLAGKIRYIEAYLPEIKKGNLSVLDVATGPGEFLEVCRYYGNDIVGIDNYNSDGKKYCDYAKFSMINHLRQNIDVVQGDFFNVVIGDENPFDVRKFDIINCQHAINFIAKCCFDFRMVDGKTYRNDGAWLLNGTFEKFFSLYFIWCKKHLNPTGSIVISALRSVNKDAYSKLLVEIAAEQGLSLVAADRHLVHKFRVNHV